MNEHEKQLLGELGNPYSPWFWIALPFYFWIQIPALIMRILGVA